MVLEEGGDMDGRTAKRQYLKTTAEGAFRPYEVQAELYDYNDKLSVRVVLPEPHASLSAPELDAKTSDFQAFIAVLNALRRRIEEKGLPLAAWEPPPPPA